MKINQNFNQKCMLIQRMNIYKSIIRISKILLKNKSIFFMVNKIVLKIIIKHFKTKIK